MTELHRAAWRRRTTRPALLVAGSTLAVVGAFGAVTANPPTSHAAVPGCETSGVYEVCVTTGGPSNPILFDEVTKKIGRTVKGDTVRIAMYTWKWNAHVGLQNAVTAADNRGVNIKLLLGSKAEKNKSAYRKFVKRLGTKNVLFCGATGNGACLSRERGPGLMHAKFVTIRSAGTTSVVTLSSNVTSGQFTKSQNSITVNGDSALHAAYRSYWKQMAKKKWAWSDAQQERAGSADMRKAYFFPRAKADPLVRVIDNNACDAEGDQVRMAISQDVRPALVKALQNAKRRGCFIRVAVSTTSAQKSVLDAPGNNFTTANVQVVPNNHNKIAYLREMQGGVLLETVFTGSHNANNHALRRANDVMLRVRNPWVARVYRELLLSLAP